MDGQYAGFVGAKTGHGLVSLFWSFVFVFLSGTTLTAFSGRHFDTVFAVGAVRRSGEHAVKTCEIHSRFGNQSRQLGDEIQRLKYDMRGPIVVGRFELIADIA